jgi:hypothetical protein
MEISENLEYQSIDSGGISEHIVNHQISDFSQKTVNGVTYRYVWEVSLYNPNLGTILSGDYWVDASTGKIETFVHL